MLIAGVVVACVLAAVGWALIVFAGGMDEAPVDGPLDLWPNPDRHPAHVVRRRGPFDWEVRHETAYLRDGAG